MYNHRSSETANTLKHTHKHIHPLDLWALFCVCVFGIFLGNWSWPWIFGVGCDWWWPTYWI